MAVTVTNRRHKIMQKLSVGKIRGLQQIANEKGIFTMCAMDHRGSVRSLICEDQEGEACSLEMIDFKVELCSHLAPHASAVLLDPNYGAAQCIAHNVLPRSTGLLVSIEATGYGGSTESRRTLLLDDWSVAKIRHMGAQAVKILVYHRPHLTELSQAQLALVEKVARDCLEHDIPFVVEPQGYKIGPEKDDPHLYAERKEEFVIETARQMTALPIDILKAEFPADLSYRKNRSELIEFCRRLDASSRVPWIILSAGVDFDIFRQQVEIACQAGASGFLGGKAVWKEAITISNTRERARFLKEVATERLKTLTQIANKYGVPWYKKLGLPADMLARVSAEWYTGYQETGGP
jgi:tagatose 1,6-diphosphate aldolase